MYKIHFRNGTVHTISLTDNEYADLKKLLVNGKLYHSEKYFIRTSELLLIEKI